jgi:uncharacterized repeat protein (TIGR03803 family)
MKALFQNTARPGGTGFCLLVALVCTVSLALSAAAQNYTNVHLFTNSPSDGANPQGGLVLAGNTLYGATAQGGTNGNGMVFRVSTDGSGFTNLYSFSTGADDDFDNLTNSDGATPVASLVLSGNILYGTTESGGSSSYGTIFSIRTDGSGFTNLYSFTGGNDGAFPLGSLLLSGNTLYGTAQQGGYSGNGTIFSIDTGGSNFVSLYSFSAENPNNAGVLTNSDGAFPQAALILSGNMLYGTAADGGCGGNGTVFTFNIDDWDLTNLYSFTAGADNDLLNLTNSDGATPVASLVLAGNTLYGTATDGGTAAGGTVFSLNTDGTDFTNLFNFSAVSDNGPDNEGSSPEAGLFLADGVLYGTTAYGGAGYGTVFQINIDGTDFLRLYSFASLIGGPNTDGANPLAGLILSSNLLYGTTYFGGLGGNGVVFGLPVSVPPQEGISSYTAFKTAIYAQTNATPPTTVDPSGPYFFGVQYFADNTNVITDGATFITPNNVNYTLLGSYISYFAYDSDYFYSKTDMDLAFPDGTYLFSINQEDLYSDLTLPSNELYSVSIPAFSGQTWNNLQSLDPGQSLALDWNSFTPNPLATSAFVFVRILDEASQTFVFQDSFLPAGTNVVLSWTNSASAYSLEYTHNLTSGVWNLITNPPVTIGNTLVFTNAICNTNTFFRLEKPE